MPGIKGGTMMKKVCVSFGTGCPRAMLDAAVIIEYFSKNELGLTSNLAESDIIIASLCGVTARAEHINLKLLSFIDKKRRAEALIIVTGCLAGIDKEKLLEISNVLPISRAQFDKFDDLIGANIKINEIPYPNDLRSYSNYLYSSLSKSERFLAKFKISGENVCKLVNSAQSYITPLSEPKPSGKGDFLIKVVDGCLSQCTYCALKLGAGEFRSRKLDDIITDMQKGISQGYKNYRLIGEDCGAYGQDIGLSVIDLLRGLTLFKGEYQIFIDDFSPIWLIKYQEELIDIFSKNNNKFGFIGIPIQSGNDRILNLMNRGYSALDVEKSLVSIRREVPNIRIRTHVIVGFPTETEKEFNNTISLLKLVDFDRVAIYKYTDRPNTIASTYTGKISEFVITKRIIKLSLALKGKARYIS
jgi:tRNA A37 methylthiotransferase MiaB